MTSRYYQETECVHGDVEPHGIGINARIAGHIDCDGGSRTELHPATPNCEALTTILLRYVTEEEVDAALAGTVLLQKP